MKKFLLFFYYLLALVVAREPDLLFVSNEPEKISTPGKLFEYKLKPSETARVVFYHLNGMSEPLRIHWQVTNLSTAPATVNYCLGIGGPHRDGIFAGHLAVRRYWEKEYKLESIYLAPGEKRSFAIQVLKPADIVAGIAFLEAYNPLQIKIYAETLSADDNAEYLIANQELNQNRIGGVFISPLNIISREFKLSEEFTPYFRIGDEPNIVDVLTKRKLMGNYGLTYHYKLKLVNDTEQFKKVIVYFAPNGGPARGVFLIDGKLVETALLVPNRADSVKALHSVELKPGETRMLDIKTMPQPGSNYPVTLLLRAY